MVSVSGPFRVFIGLVSQGYLNHAKIRETLREGLTFCQVNRHITSKTVIRPEMLCADPDLPPYGYTHPALVQELLGIVTQAPFFCRRNVILSQSHEFFNTRYNFMNAHGAMPQLKSRGYYQFEKDFPGTSIETIDGTADVEFLLGKGNILSERRDSQALTKRFWSKIISSRHFNDSSCVIYCPKIRLSNIAQGFKGALTLGGMESLITHQYYQGFNGFNNQRIADFLEVVNPQIIISDGIYVGTGGSELTAAVEELGLIVVANNAVAHDLVVAEILNLKASEIGYLKAAIERGWGPDSIKKIILGGMAEEGLKLLKNKTRLWSFPCKDLISFEKDYEKQFEKREEFPFEVLEDFSNPNSGISQLFLNWLYLTYDLPGKRKKMPRWPKMSVVLGKTFHKPKYSKVLVLGDKAIESMRSQSQNMTVLLKRGSRSLVLVTLKNNKRYWMVFQEGNPPKLEQISKAFLWASFFRIRTGFLRFIFFEKSLFQSVAFKTVKTMKKNHNRWWNIAGSLEKQPE